MRGLLHIRASEVNWVDAYIEPSRSETGVKARFALWDETLRLMRQKREEDAEGDDRLFLTRDGNPLAWPWGSKGRHHDLVLP